MQFSITAAVATLLMVSSASAKSILSITHAPRANADLSFTASAMIRRALHDTTSSTHTPKEVLNSTESACVARLASLNGVATSPTGMSLCYEISNLDVTTGNFVSQIYLWQVSQATGNWTNINSTSLNVNIAYTGANLTQAAASTKRSTLLSSRSTLRARSTASTSSSAVLIASQELTGQVLQNWDPNNQASQMLALQPIVTVTALTGDSAQFPIHDTLSVSEAAFVTGVFAQPAAAAAAAAAAALASPPFVLPGTTISPQIFPVGMIITGIWMVFLTAVLSAGTITRLRLRNAYRRKARTAQWVNGAISVPKAAVGYEKR